MDLPDVGYDLSPTWATRLMVLDWCYVQGQGGAAGQFGFDPLFEAFKGSDDQLGNELRELDRVGWLNYAGSLGWEGNSGQLTPTGVEVAEDLRRRRDDAPARRRAARDALLGWLYRQALDGRAWSALFAREMGPAGYFYGQLFTDADIEHAARWLAERLYVLVDTRSTTVFNKVVTWLVAQITGAGDQVVEDGVSVNDRLPAPSTTVAGPAVTITDSPGANVMMNSPHASQSSMLAHDDRQQIIAVADGLDAVRKAMGLTPEQDQAAAGQAAELRQAVSRPDVDRTLVRRLLDQIRETAETAAVTAVGALVATSVDEAKRRLGIG